MKQITITVESSDDGYVAYADSDGGIVIGQGITFEEAVADVSRAIQSHLEVVATGAHSPKVGKGLGMDL